MAVVKNWDYRNKYFEIKSGGQSEMSASASYEGFGFRKAKDFFGVYKKGDRLILHVNGEEFDVDLASCGVSYSHNPLFERVKITSSQKTVFKKTYWLLGKLGHLDSEQPMDAIDEEQQLFFPWLKKVVEKKIVFQTD